MNADPFTPNQRLAIGTLDRSCVVTAGPGAGKTRVLVERVINILEKRRADLEAIVAITFTNKAANEMKDRIRRALTELSLAAGQPGQRRRWHEMKRRLEDAAISTFHSFCAGVLRANPVEAQVDPQVAILDENTSRVLLYDAVESVVSDLADEGDPVGARLIIGYTRSGLIERLMALYSTIRGLGLTPAEVEQLSGQRACRMDDYYRALRELDVALSELAALTGLTAKMNEQITAAVEVWTRYESQLKIEPRIDRAGQFDEAMKALQQAKIHRTGRVKELASQWADQVSNLDLVFYDLCAREVIKTIVRALDEIENRYRTAKAGRNGLDYEDLQLKVRDLFRTHPRLARQYADRYRYILVDEFQDTNGLQREILNLLVSEDSRLKTQDASLETNLFIVGDGKQSVYNFRGAAVEVFTEVAEDLKQRGAAVIGLDKNFRSTASLIEFFNDFFSSLMALGPEHDRSVLGSLGYIEFAPGGPHRPASPHPAVELLLDAGEHIENMEAAREWEATRIAERIARMVEEKECLVSERDEAGAENFRPVQFGDIALLFRAMSDIKIYERALRKRGIPYYVIAGRGFYQREEIQDILSLLRVLENRTDEIALVSALRSSMFGLSDETLFWLRHFADTAPDEVDKHHPMMSSLLKCEAIGSLQGEQRSLASRAAKTLSELMAQRNRVRLVNLLQQILDLTDYVSIQATFYDGHQRVANLRKLVELARGFEERGPHFLRDFIEFVAQFTRMETPESEAPVDAGAEDVVRIMTVHKAKGLEFPIVIIPDMARESRSTIPSLAFDRGVGIGVKVPDQRGRLHDTTLRQLVGEHVRWREFFEDQRLLFVAATRAEDYLILAGTARKVRTGSKKTDSDAPSYQIAPPAPLQGMSSWFDWLCAVLDISDPPSLPEIYEWKGHQLRVSQVPTYESEERSRSDRIVDRFVETREGKAIAESRLPELSKADEEVLDAVVRRMGSIPDAPSPPRRSLAVTGLLSFARCPLQYYYETVLGLPGVDEFDELADLSSGSSVGVLSATARGIVVHEFCERHTGADSWEELLRGIVNEHVVIAEDDEIETARRRAFDEARPLVEHYLRSDLWREIEQILWGGKPGRVESEAEFRFRLGAATIRGRIDKLIVDGEGRARIVDFKTNRVASERVPILAEEYRLQMQVYALAARRALGLQTVRAELYFLDPDVRFELPDDDLDELTITGQLSVLWERLIRVREIDQADAQPGPDKCRRCRCFSFCPSRAQ